MAFERKCSCRNGRHMYPSWNKGVLASAAHVRHSIPEVAITWPHNRADLQLGSENGEIAKPASRANG